MSLVICGRELPNSTLSGKSNNGHTHDDRYFTESEINSKLNGKANNNHSHASITTRSGSNSISFDWVNKVSAGWKIDVYINNTLVRSNW